MTIRSVASITFAPSAGSASALTCTIRSPSITTVPPKWTSSASFRVRMIPFRRTMRSATLDLRRTGRERRRGHRVRPGLDDERAAGRRPRGGVGIEDDRRPRRLEDDRPVDALLGLQLAEVNDAGADPARVEEVDVPGARFRHGGGRRLGDDTEGVVPQ